MAFDSKAAGQFGRGADAPPLPSGAAAVVTDNPVGPASAALDAVRARIVELSRALTRLDRLKSALGTPGDTAALRATLAGEERRTALEVQEIDGALRRLRAANAASATRPTERHLERLGEQYLALRGRIVETIRASQLRQRQYALPEPSPAAAAAAAAAEAAAAAGAGGRDARADARARGVGGAGAAEANGDDGTGVQVDLAQVQAALRPLGNTEEAIREEKREAAIDIAREAAALKEIMGDTQTLVVQQGETLDVVEANVDDAVEASAAAVQELETAARYHRQYKGKCCIFWLCAGLVLAVVAIPVVIFVLPKVTG